MKSKQTLVKQITLATGLLLLAAVFPAIVPGVHATALTWDANTGTAGAQDGTGNWPGGNWWNGAADATWNNATPDSAIIGAGSGAAGTIAVSVNTVGNITFNAAGSGNYAISGGTLTLSNSTITVNSAASIASVLAGTTGLTKSGAGTLTLSGANTYTGNTTNSAGTLKLDFTASGAPTANIINAASALKLNGGTVQTLGASGGSSQTFASTAFAGTTSGQSVITNAAVSGTMPTNNLGVLTGQQGALVRFDGAAYISDPSTGTNLGVNTVAATGVYNVTANTISGGLIAYSTYGGAAGAYATVGLYDWAAVSGGTVGTAQTGTIVGGSQISGFYTMANGSLPANTFGVNMDMTASGSFDGNNTSQSASYSTLRFNTNSAITINTGRALGGATVGGVLVTPNVGATNITIAPQTGTGANASFQASRATGGATGLTVWQNNTSGELIITANYVNGANSAATASYSQGGPGTVLLKGVNGYSGQTFLDGGYTVITNDANLGAVATGANVNINGGTLFGNATFNLDNAGANLHQVYLSGAGGTLAASAGNTLTVNGYISGSVNLTIGTGTIAGTGAGTANATPIVGSGTVALNGAGNGYSGGTTITGGATLNLNSVWALGGAGYGGLTFNNGTLQYNSTPLNVALDITEDTSNGGTGLAGGVAKPVTLAGNGTIDLNGNAVVYTNSVGNNGGGALTVASSLPNGSLTLLAPSTYTGGTTVSGGTLNAVNTTGSATGTGGVTVNGGTLTGTGNISGAVTNLSGTLSPSGTNGILTLASLVLNGGNTLFSFDAGSHTNGIINLTGALTLTSGNVQVSITDGTLANGTYRLINCSGTPGGSVSALSVSGFAQSGQVASLQAVSGGLNLVIGSYVAQNLIWVGDGLANLWNVNAALNWNDTGPTPANPSVFHNGDNTFLDDTSTNTTVSLVGALTPASVTVNGTKSYTIASSGSIGGATALTNNSSGTLTILTTNTYTGATIINSGTVQLGNGTASGAIGTGGVSNNAALIVNSPSQVTTGPINGSGNVTVEAGGTLAIGGNSTINTLTLGGSGTNGILDLAGNSLTVSNLALASGATTSYVGNGGTVAASTINYNGGSSSFAGVIEDVLGSGTKTMALNVNSSGILTLTAANTYSGGTVINSGQVTLTGSGSLGSGLVTLNGGTLYENGTVINNVISNAPSATSSLNYNNTTGGSYGPTLNLVGGGTLNLNITGSGVFSPGTASSMSGFTGTINLSGAIRAGTVTTATTFGDANALWNLGTAGSINNKYGHQTIYLGALNGGAGSTLTGGNTANGLAATIYVVGNLNTTNTYGGNITDGSADYTGLTKVGTGVLILNGATYNYSSPTIVSNGTLEMDSTMSDYSATTNYAGATLAGIGTFTGPVDMEPGSTLAPGGYGAGNYGTLNLSTDGSIPGNGLSENGCTNLFDISSTNSDVVNVTGGLSLAGVSTVKLNIVGTLPDANYTLINYSGGLISGSVLANLTVTPAQVGNQFFTLVDTGSAIQLHVFSAGTNSLTWLPVPPGVNNSWDASTVNWTNNGVDYEAFLSGDSVTFNDFAGTNSTVYLPLGTAPNSVVVSNNSVNYAFSGPGKITGSVAGGLTKGGTGTLTILTTNDFTGPTLIKSGVVQVGDGTTTNTALSSGSVTNNALLIFNQPDNSALTTNLTGTGSLVKRGAGTLTMQGNTTYGGTTLVDTGTLQFGNGAATAFPTNAISLTNNGTIAFDLAGTYAVSNGIVGNGTVIFNGPGTNTFGGLNAYTNNTYVNGGVVKLAGPAVLPTGVPGWTILDGGTSAAGTLDLNGNNQTLNGLSGNANTVLGRIVNNGGTGTNTLTINNWSTPTYAGLIEDTNVVGSSGKVALVIAGTGTQTLTGANTYSGGTTVNKSATLIVSSAGNLGTGMTTLTGGTLGSTGNIYLNGVGLTVPAGTNGTINMPAAMKLPILYGSGTLTLNVSNQVPQNSSSVIGDCLSTCANFTGTLNAVGAASGAVLVCNHNNSGGGSFDGNLTNATVNLITGVGGVRLVGMNNSGGNTAQFGALNVDASSALGGAFYAGSQTYQIGALNTPSDIEGVITNGPGGASAITKVGTGTLLLNNSGNTYTGKTTVNAGTLLVNGQITASPVTVNTGGTLSGVGTIGNFVTVNGTLAPGNPTTAGTLTCSGNVTNTATGTNLMKLDLTHSANDKVAVAGNLVYAGTLNVSVLSGSPTAGQTFTLFSAGTMSGNFTSVVGSPGAGLTYSFNPSSGVLTVVGSVNLTPTNIITSVSGNVLTLSWPMDHTGWLLQSNSLDLMNTNDWFTVPGSSATNQVNVNVNPASTNVFYRLEHN